jgi:hypothetical protein
MSRPRIRHLDIQADDLLSRFERKAIDQQRRAAPRFLIDSTAVRRRCKHRQFNRSPRVPRRAMADAFWVPAKLPLKLC